MQVVVLIKDLMLGSQIKEACSANHYEYRSARDIDRFRSHLEGPLEKIVVVDLNASQADPFAAIGLAVSDPLVKKTVCFYSHVDRDAAEKAGAAGAKEIYPRSKFFADIPGILQA